MHRHIAAVVSASLLAALAVLSPASATASGATAGRAASSIVSAQSLTYGSTLNFNQVMPGSGVQQAQEAVFYENVATPTPTFYNMTITGPNASEFYVTQTTCRGQSPGCYVYVTFVSGIVAGIRTATLSLYDDVPGSPQTVTLLATVSTAGVSVSPKSIDFGLVPANTTSAPKTVTVTSAGTGPLTITSIYDNNSNPNPFFHVVNDQCSGHTFAPGATCTYQATFTPSDQNFRSTYLGVAGNATACCALVNVSGTGLSPWTGYFVGYGFGALNVGVTRTHAITITNSGNGDLTITSDQITGSNPSNFTITSDACSGTTVHPGASCDLAVAAHATAVGGSYAASLKFNDNAPTNDVIPLTVSGVNASATVTTSSLELGTGTSSAVTNAPFTVTSNGPDPLSIEDMTITGPNASDYYLSPTCAWTTIASGSSCTTYVNFWPVRAEGVDRNATLIVNDSTGSHQITIHGTSDGPGMHFSVDPMNFGSVNRGSPVTITQTITNNGNAALTVTSIGAFQVGPGFSVVNDTCTNVSVPVGGSCTYGLRYDPCCETQNSGNVEVHTSSTYNSYVLTATGHAPVATINLITGLPNTPAGTTSAPVTMTVTNTGTLNLNLTGFSFADSTDFGIGPGTDHCSGATVAPASSCTVGIVFSPAHAIPYSTNVTVMGNINPFNLTFSGLGTTPWAGMVPAVSLGSVEQTDSSPPTMIDIRNIMEAPLHVSGVTFSNPNAGFSLVSQTCQNVPHGGACQLVLQFSPTAIGAAATAMTLVDDEAAPEQLTLTGTGLVKARCTNGTLGSSSGPNAAQGNIVTLYASASTCALPRYRFSMQDPHGLTTVVQDFSSSATYSWYTSGLPLGGYTFTVEIKDFSSASTDTSALTTILLGTPPCSSVRLSTDRVSPAPIGTNIVFSANTATCGMADYQFWMLAPGSSTWVIAQPYSPNNTFLWISTGMPAGNYNFMVWARDEHSAGTAHNTLGTWDAYIASQFLLTTTATCNLMSGSVTPFAYAYAGSQVNMSFSTRYCPDPKYKIWVLPPGYTKWLLMSDWFGDPIFPSFQWNTAWWIGGTYHFVVWAKDAGSPGVYGNSLGRWDTYVAFSYLLVPVYCTSVDVSATNYAATVTINMSAGGCPDPLYEVWVLYPGASKWSLLRGYAASNFVQFDFAGRPTGRYYFSIWARDASSLGYYQTSLGRFDDYFEGYIDWS